MLRIIIDIETDGISDLDLMEFALKNEKKLISSYARAFGNVYAEELIEGGSDRIEATMVEIHQHQHGDRGSVNCIHCDYYSKYTPEDLQGVEEDRMAILERQ